jgi:pilus assembly protein CpaB
MKRRGISMVLLSLVFGIAAAWAAKSWVEQRARAARSTDAGTSVVLATMEIPYATRVEGRHVKVITVPSGTPLGNHFNSIAEIEGLIATQRALSGEVLLKERFTRGGPGSTLAALVKPDMRAVTVRVDDVVGVAGFLMPGNHVDIVAARKLDNDRATTETVLMNINVLAVDQTTSQDKNEPVVVRAVTLEMTPQEAEILVKAREEGRLQLTLRNPADDLRPQLVATPEPAPVIEPVKPVRRAQPRPAAPSVTIIRGTLVDNERTSS